MAFLTSIIESVKQNQEVPPDRPGEGCEGFKTSLKANYVKVNVDHHKIIIYQYSVNTNPYFANGRINRSIMSELASKMGNWPTYVYNGENKLYTITSSLTESVVHHKVQIPCVRDKTFYVTLRSASQFEFDPTDPSLQSVEVINCLLKQNFLFDGNHLLGKLLYSKDTHEFRCGLVARNAHFQSIQQTQTGLLLNTDVSGAIFYPAGMKVSDYVFKMLDIRFSDAKLIRSHSVKIGNHLNGIKVDCSFGKGYRYTISYVSRTSATATYRCNKSVERYFDDTYRIKLNFPELPCLMFGETYAQAICVPMELCVFVENQKCLDNPPRLQKYFEKSPRETENAIVKLISGDGYFLRHNLFKDKGINVTSDLVVVNARVLPSPGLRYGADYVKANHGKWMLSKNNKVTKSCNLVLNSQKLKWGIVNFSPLTKEKVDEFSVRLMKCCKSLGMDFEELPAVRKLREEGTDLTVVVEITLKLLSDLALKYLQGKQLDLIVVILSPKEPESHAIVKRYCDTELGVISQCLLQESAISIKDLVVEHIALKINAKLGGINHYLSQNPFPWETCTIIFGADVTHPSAGCSASIAAVVGSLDWPGVSRYEAAVAAQHPTSEIIADLQNMVSVLLQSFQRSVKSWPEKIIFYRDGVSNSQFSDVILLEVNAIRKACSAIDDKYQPQITFIVVQKRHHTRFFPTSTVSRSNGNILAGTVVDSGVCHHKEFDFYLCSHSPTKRPVHYHVLVDENQFTADALQALTYNLCFTFSKSLKSSCIVPAVQYAHLAAYRARCYDEGQSSSSATETASTETPSITPVKDSVKELMYYL